MGYPSRRMKGLLGAGIRSKIGNCCHAGAPLVAELPQNRISSLPIWGRQRGRQHRHHGGRTRQKLKGAPARVIGSPRIAPADDGTGPAHLSTAASPGCSPCENPFPFIGLPHGRPPPNDHHREVAVLLMRSTLHNGRRNPGDFGLQIGCARTFFRHMRPIRALLPPGGDCAPSRPAVGRTAGTQGNGGTADHVSLPPRAGTSGTEPEQGEGARTRAGRVGERPGTRLRTH
jgi:hypothetical protein